MNGRHLREEGVGNLKDSLVCPGMTDLRFKILCGYLWDWSQALPPGKSSGSREVRLRIEMKRRRLRGSSGFFVLFHHRPPTSQGTLSDRGTQSWRRLETHMETKRKTLIPREIQMLKTIIIRELSLVWHGQWPHFYAKHFG